MKKYYGFEYKDGINTTTGQPNNGFERFNGRLSIAGNAHIFTSQKQRIEWIEQGCNSYGGRISVNRAQLRRLCAGMTNNEFSEYLNYLEIESQI